MFTLERVIKQNIEREIVHTETSPDGSTTTVRMSPLTRETFRYVIRGSDLRREAIEGSSLVRLETVYQDNWLDFVPKSRQGWVRPARSLGGAIEPLDPRCLGFEPLLRLTDWFDRARVQRASPYRSGEDKGILVEAVDVQGSKRGEARVSAWFSEGHNYLPIKVRHWIEGGQFFRLTDIRYQRVASRPAWFPEAVVSQFWAHGDPTPPTTAPRAVWQHTVQPPLIVDRPAPDSLFDPEIPVGTHLINTSGDRGPTIEVTEKGRTVTTAFPDQPVAPARSHGWVLVISNAALLAACVAFRRRIQF